MPRFLESVYIWIKSVDYFQIWLFITIATKDSALGFIHKSSLVYNMLKNYLGRTSLCCVYSMVLIHCIRLYFNLTRDRANLSHISHKIH